MSGDRVVSPVLLFARPSLDNRDRVAKIYDILPDAWPGSPACVHACVATRDAVPKMLIVSSSALVKSFVKPQLPSAGTFPPL